MPAIVLPVGADDGDVVDGAFVGVVPPDGRLKVAVPAGVDGLVARLLRLLVLVDDSLLGMLLLLWVLSGHGLLLVKEGLVFFRKQDGGH